MSKSDPQSGIYVHDTREQIFEKIRSAYCAPRETANNPILDYSKHIIFRRLDSLRIQRPEKYGGDLELGDYGELERLYAAGEIHPLDLKNGVAEALDELVKPIRQHFEKNAKARRLYEVVRSAEVTR
jgi:tyrosyl-tRNA synthetase